MFPLIAIIVIALFTQNIDTFVSQITHINIFWVILAFALMLLYWCAESLALRAIAKFHKIKQKFKKFFLITLTGQFFNSITPFATGGQPAQVVHMVKEGLDLGNATSIVLMKFIVYQSIFCLYAVVTIIFSYSYFRPRVPMLLTMFILGLSVHASMIFITILFAYSKKLARKVINLVLAMLEKFKLIKEGKESFYANVESSIKKFYHNADLLKKNPKLLIETSIFIFLELTFYNLIPFCIYKALGISGTNILDIFFASALIATIVSIVPLPGAIVGAEGSFFIFFQSFFNQGNILEAILLWRIITYYSCIAIGGLVVTLFFSNSKKL